MNHNSYLPRSNVTYGSLSVGDDIESDTKKILTPSYSVRDRITVVANALNALLGVALFAMPWGFQESGVVGGGLVVVMVAVLSFETTRILLVAQKVWFQQTGEVKGYPEIAGSALGPMWHVVVQIATCISCLGGCTGYIIFFGQTLGQAFDVQAQTVILFATIPLIFLSWIRTFHELTTVTIFGVVALISSVIILLIDGSESTHHMEKTPMFLPETTLNFVGSATFLFTIHYCILSIGAENLRSKPWLALQRSVDRGNGTDGEREAGEQASQSAFQGLEQSIAWSYMAASIIIFIVGSFGFVMYRNSPLVRDDQGNIVQGCEMAVCQNVILNISPGILRNLVGVTMSLVIMFSYLVILAPAREHVEEAVLRWIQPKTPVATTVTMNTLRTLLVLVNVMVAIRAPYFGGMLSAVGGLTDAMLCFVLPPLIFRGTLGAELSTRQHLFYMAVVVWGVLVICYTFWHVVELAFTTIIVLLLVVGGACLALNAYINESTKFQPPNLRLRGYKSHKSPRVGKQHF